MSTRDCGCLVRQPYLTGILPQLQEPVLDTAGCAEHGVTAVDVEPAPSYGRLLRVLVVLVAVAAVVFALGFAVLAATDPDRVSPHGYLVPHDSGTAGR